MTLERKIVVLEALLRVIVRRRDFSFENFKRDLGNLAKATEVEKEEIQLVLGPIYMDLFRETFGKN